MGMKVQFSLIYFFISVFSTFSFHHVKTETISNQTSDHPTELNDTTYLGKKAVKFDNFYNTELK